MGGLLWRASCENTSVPGGPLALQVKPALNVSRVEMYTSADPLKEGRPKNLDWQTRVLGIREVMVAPTNAVTAGLTGRPVVGRIAPAWTATRNAFLGAIGGLVDHPATLGGVTPNGTECGGPTFGAQAVLPVTGGPVQQLLRMKYVWPSSAPLIIYGAGTIDYDQGETTIPHPAFILYMPASQSTTPQTFSGDVVFEEM
jgi:hypothetical protein